MTELGEKDTDLGEKNTNLMVASHASQHAMGGTVAGSHALHKDIAIIRDTHVPEEDMPAMPRRHILKRTSSSMEAAQIELRVQAAFEKEVADSVAKARPKPRGKKGSTTEEPGQSKVTVGMKKDASAARAQVDRLIAAHKRSSIPWTKCLLSMTAW